MEAVAQEAHAEMIITVTRPDGSTQSAKFVSVNTPDNPMKVMLESITHPPKEQ